MTSEVATPTSFSYMFDFRQILRSVPKFETKLAAVFCGLTGTDLGLRAAQDQRLERLEKGSSQTLNARLESFCIFSFRLHLLHLRNWRNPHLRRIVASVESRANRPATLFYGQFRRYLALLTRLTQALQSASSLTLQGSSL